MVKYICLANPANPHAKMYRICELLNKVVESTQKMSTTKKRKFINLADVSDDVFEEHIMSMSSERDSLLARVAKLEKEMKAANRMRKRLEVPGINHPLAMKLEAHFKPLGVAAFSRCCRYGCTDTYAEDPAFKEISRDQGIYFIRFHLDGMNYDDQPENFFAYYQDFDYLMQEWESEQPLLVKWCSILGLKPSEYTIVKPENENQSIMVKFSEPFSMEPPKEPSDDDY